MCLVAVALTVLSLATKLPCAAPTGVTPERIGRLGCWSDVTALWNARDLGLHLLPYVNGTYTSNPPNLTGGAVEYPTLGGLWIWLTALPADSAVQYLVVTAVVAAVLAVVVTLLLARLAGRRAWIFAATTPLALYALYNWDLLPIVCTVLGVVAMRSRHAPATRYLLAGLAFGTGAAFKLYPLMFVAAVVVAALFDRGDGRALRTRIGHAAVAVAGGVVVPLAANLPFALVDLQGWLAPFRFQTDRVTGASTLSVWFYGLQPWSATSDPGVQHRLTELSTASTAIGIVAVLATTVVLALRRGTTPWLQCAAAMLAVYIVCNKVDSLQYVLWLMPFFVLLRVGGWWITAYLLADLAAFVGWYRGLYYGSLGNTATTWATEALAVGIWGRAALLVALVAVFLRAEVAGVSGSRSAESVASRDAAAVPTA